MSCLVLRRNLVLIFQGRQISTVDTDAIIERKARIAKYQALRGSGYVVMAWATSFTHSAWEEHAPRACSRGWSGDWWKNQ